MLWIGLYAVAGDGIVRGTTVAGVDIGGHSPAAARALLEQQLADRSRAPIPVAVGDVRTTISPTRAGLILDVAATVSAAPTRSWNPVTLVVALLEDDDVDLVVTVDGNAMRAAMSGLADRVDRGMREGAVEFEGESVVAVLPREGRSLHRGAAVGTLRASWLRVRGDIRLPATVHVPDVTAHEVRRAVREFAAPAVAEPVTLEVGPRVVTLTRRALGRSLSMRATPGGRLRPRVDGEWLQSVVAPRLVGVGTPARDATFRIVAGRPRVVASRTGKGADPAELASTVLSVLTRTGADRSVALPLRATEPAVSTRQAAGLGVTELVAKYTTYYPSDFPPRLTNIHRAADLMDHTLVLPGTVFSLNDTVGERTAERGFAAGFIIDDGQLEVDFGGGVSQLATTTFNAAFFAGLEIVEHHPHSFYISRYPEGRESTVAWGVKDVRFRNDSGHGIFVTTGYTDNSVTVKVWGTKRFRIEATKSPRYSIKPYRTIDDPRPAGTDRGSCVASDGVPGFKVDVFRLFLQGGKQVGRERFHTAYAPENQVRCSS